MAPWPLVVGAGFAIGLLIGLFGVGGSSVATPLLSMLGVSALGCGGVAPSGHKSLVELQRRHLGIDLDEVM